MPKDKKKRNVPDDTVNPHTGIPYEEERETEEEYFRLFDELNTLGRKYESCMSRAHGCEFLDPAKCAQADLDPAKHTARMAELTNATMEMQKRIGDKYGRNAVRLMCAIGAKYNGIEYKDPLVGGSKLPKQNTSVSVSKYSKKKVRQAADYIGKNIILSKEDTTVYKVVGIRVNEAKEMNLEVKVDGEEVFEVIYKQYDIVE